MKTTTFTIGVEDMPAFVKAINNTMLMSIILKEGLGAAIMITIEYAHDADLFYLGWRFANEI